MGHTNDAAPDPAATGCEGQKVVVSKRHSHTPPPASIQERGLALSFQDMDERERERVLAEFRVERIRAQLFLAELDCIGVLVKQKLMTPSAARDWFNCEGFGGPIIEAEAREVASA
jgi:hypothetical protein